MPQANKNNISGMLRRLEEVAHWFDAQSDIDVEEGLKKVREGAALIKELKGKLKKVENEFQEIRKELEGGEEEE